MQGMIDLTREGFFPRARKSFTPISAVPPLNGYSYYYKDG
ncbi:hypothetical protein QO004_002929 [Rhizobium mesoamericanum]|nr:hypothetical protein [Rhizobium mesoamericanum]